MTRFRSALADALDAMVEGGRVALTETAGALAIYRLEGHEVRRLLELSTAAGWADYEISDQGGVVGAADIQDEDFDLTVRVRKPGIPDGVEALLTRHGLEATLARAEIGARIWVQGLNLPFETLTVRFSPWEDAVAFEPQPAPASPRAVVRILNDDPRFPEDLGRWLLRDETATISGRGIDPWRRMAVERLARAMCNEIEADGRLLFRGPPVARFQGSAAGMIEASSLEALVRAAKWVFENPREIENRHALFAAEMSRTALKGGDSHDLAGVAGPAFESARIAYQFGVTQQSKDTLKALTDLRKAVGDETAKLAETTRGLATAITGAVVANLGIIVARLSIAANSRWVPAAAITIGLVLAIYVGAITLSGFQFLWLQRSLRSEWRSRLYRFLDDSEYHRMVTAPVESAERAFRIAAIIGCSMTMLLLVAVVLIARS